MSKQVRLRRGTTAAHATFTGAQGEVTFDTDKNCLVVHDGVTPGGKPVAALAVNGNTLTVPYLTTFPYGVTFEQGVLTPAVGLMYTAVVTLGLRGYPLMFLGLAGDVTFVGSAHQSGYVGRIKITCDSVPRSLAFPAAWKWLGSPAPTSLPANKAGLLELICFGSTDAHVLARWTVEP